MSTIHVITVMFFTFFFENPKKRDFLRFFALLHTFSRTMGRGTLEEISGGDWIPNLTFGLSEPEGFVQMP